MLWQAVRHRFATTDWAVSMFFLFRSIGMVMLPQSILQGYTGTDDCNCFPHGFRSLENRYVFFLPESKSKL